MLRPKRGTHSKNLRTDVATLKGQVEGPLGRTEAHAKRLSSTGGVEMQFYMFWLLGRRWTREVLLGPVAAIGARRVLGFDPPGPAFEFIEVD